MVKASTKEKYVAKDIAVLGAEAMLRLDIRLPDHIIWKFRDAVLRKFSIVVGLWAVPPLISPAKNDNSRPVYACGDAMEEWYHHGSVIIVESEKEEFFSFLEKFCKKHGMQLSPGILKNESTKQNT
jgi:hypothetical protein